MIHEHHFEVYVSVDTDTGRPIGISPGDREMDDRVFDVDNERWLPLNEQSPWWPHDRAATFRLDDTLALPAKIIAAYRLNTGPNGYDIQIMADVMAALVDGGWVDEDDWIAGGEYSDRKMICDTCGTVGNEDDGIDVGEECPHDDCEGSIAYYEGD